MGSAFLEFKDVVKASAGAGVAAPAARSPDAIDAAAKTLSEKSYPFMKDIDWFANYFAGIPGVKPAAWMKAIKVALDQGAKMDWAYLQEGALAHLRPSPTLTPRA